VESRLPTLQSLRAVAALAVVAFHLSQWLSVDFRIGQAGVDLFFVISGAVMWVSAVERDAEPGLFLARRALRILPPYWLATLALIPLALWGPRPLMHVHPQPLHVALSLLLVPHDDPEHVPFPLLTQGWTLIYEAGFYALIALSLTAAKARRMWVIGGVIAALVIWGISWHPAYWFGANLMLLQFLAGCWLGRLAVRGALPAPTIGAALMVAGLACFAGLHLLALHSDPWRPILWGVPATLIVAGALSLDTRSGLAGPARLKPLEWLGGASYSIYLWHTAAFFVVVNLMPYKPWPFAPLAFAAAMALSLAAWRLIEVPCLALSRALRVPRPPALDYAAPPDGPVAQPDRAAVS
jgi:exopolysaccharide production protein ExoZ